MRGLLTLVLFSALSGCANSNDNYSNRFEDLTRQHYRLTAMDDGAAWEKASLPVHNSFWMDVLSTCTGQAKDGGISRFDAIAVIDKDGAVTEFLTMPKSEHLRCFSVEMIGRQYPAPPTAPFYQLFKVTLSE